jgi:hypothetical protein
VSSARAGRRRRRSRRLPLETLFPLLAAYCALAALYAWQAWRRETPAIFTDELELTQISRAIADTGLPARRGESYDFTSLAPWLTAPAWWIKSVPDAFAAVKYVQVLVMTAAIFPAYALARLVVSRPWALFAAVATVAAPALSYSSVLVEEPFAYPAAALAFLLLVRAVAVPSRGRIALAAGSCGLATLMRSQLIALFAVWLLSLLALTWRSHRIRSWRATWNGWDRAGAVVLAVGAVLLVSAAIGHLSEEWFVTTAYWKGRILEYGLWSGGAFAIGIGILPLIAALAALGRRPKDWRDANGRAFVIVTAAAIASLGWYAAIKGAYVSTVFSSLVVERNLVYLTPLVFTGTAVLFSRRNSRGWAVLGAGGLVLWMVSVTPMKLDHYPYYEAHGLSILAFANRVWSWPEARIDTALMWIVIGATAVVALLGLVRMRTRTARLLVLPVVVAVLAWNLTAEIYASQGERDLSTRFRASFTEPPDWIDRLTRGGSVLLLGQQFGTDTNRIHLLEFWNRSIAKVWSVDPSSAAPGPGPQVTTDLARSDGTLFPDPGTDYVLAVNGVALQAPVVSSTGAETLYRLMTPSVRLAYSQTGVFSDGWMSDAAAYNRFDAPRSKSGEARVTLSRIGGCGKVPGSALVSVGPLVIGPDHQPKLAHVTDQESAVIRPCLARALYLRTPPGPWRIEVRIGPTFVPAELNPEGSSDTRRLGAQVGFEFLG